MVSIASLLDYLDKLLTPNLFKDYCPNGLQVAGVEEITRIVSGVSANQALTQAAIQENADLILVHHGYFWKGEGDCITGIRHARLSPLIKNDINLLSYHLPLDAHAKFGNNIQLAERLNIKPTSEFYFEAGPAIARLGTLKQKKTGSEFSAHIESVLDRKPFYIPGKSEKIESIAWCSGAAQDLLLEASQHNVDAFLTGEVSERTVALAQELGIHFYAAGHHATERYGVLSLGEHLAKKFNLYHRYIDIDNPV